MLNKQKVFQQLQSAVPQFFLRTNEEMIIAGIIWQRLIDNPALLESVISTKTDWMLPSWKGDLNHVTSIKPIENPYGCFSVDGSQIYPDKHQGSSCYLLNVGIVELFYLAGPSKIVLDSIPSVHMNVACENEEISTDIVNCMRGELELKVGYQRMSAALTQAAFSSLPTVFLCDGSLIFWHLETKDEDLKNRFLTSYISILDQYYKHSLPILGYISLPKAKDVTNLIRVVLEKDLLPNETFSQETINNLVDADIMSLYLAPWQRSQIFANHAPITAYYPNHLKPHFVYLNVIDEIVRIEMPAWIARDEKMLDNLLAIVVDQCKKGGGYPVALAEAHEQAVVKAADREFFYQLLHKVSLDNNQSIGMSQKLMKKRKVGI